MRERTRRIVRGMYASGSTGAPWAFVVALLVTFALCAAAQAQPPLPEHDVVARDKATTEYVQYHRPEHDLVAMQRIQKQKQREQAEHREAMAGRLERLVDEAHEIEVHLREMDEEAEDEKCELRTRLEELREQIELFEHRLARMGREGHREPECEHGEWREREGDPHLDELMRHREELLEAVHHKEMEMEELHHHLKDREHDIHNELRGIHEEIEELMRRREELAERARHRERELEELRENTERRRHEIGLEMREIHEQMKHIEDELARRQREREERRRRMMEKAHREIEEMTAHLHGLRERAEHMQHMLEKMDAEEDEAMELRHALAETREQIREIERKLHRHPAPPRPPRRWPMSPPPHEHRREHEECEEHGHRERPEPKVEEDPCQELREEIELLKTEQQETNALLERLIIEDHPSTVGSAGSSYYH